MAVGLFPAIAAWGLMILGQTLGIAGRAVGDMDLAGRVLDNPGAFAEAGFHLDGMVALSQGFMLTGMIWAAACAQLIDRRFRSAAVWTFWGAGFSFLGFMHAGHLTPVGAVYEIGFYAGGRWALGYLLCGLFFLLMDTPSLRRRNTT